MCVVILLITALTAGLVYYVCLMIEINPSMNYTIHANVWLNKKGLIKEKFSGPVEIIYLDDFLEYSTDENCEVQV